MKPEPSEPEIPGAAEGYIFMFILIAARPDLVRFHEWMCRPWRRALRQFVFMTAWGIAATMAAAYSKPKVDALRQFEQEHGRYPTLEEEEALFDALKREPGTTRGQHRLCSAPLNPGA